MTAVTNVAGQVAYRSTYSAFGQMSRTSYDLTTTRLAYTGRETSVGGLLQSRSRYYDPGQGRFLQQDSYRGNDAIPPSLHRYTYVHNNPVNYVDPDGNAGRLPNLGELSLTLPWPTLETILWAALDMLTFFLLVAASGPQGSAALALAVGWFAMLASSMIGAIEIFLNSNNLSIGEKIFLFALWVLIEVGMFQVGCATFAMLNAVGAPFQLPTNIIFMATVHVAIVSYVMWVIDQSVTGQASSS